MSATGKDTSTSTTSSFVSALVVACVTVGALSLLWLVLHSRHNLRRVYQPRTILAPESKRPNGLPDGPLPFWKTVFSVPDTEIIVANGVDAYFFLRFIRVFGLYMLVPYFLLTFIILIPLHAVSPTAGLQELNILTFGNVSSAHQLRHIGDIIVALILIFWTLYLIYHEYNHFVEIRQGWLSSPQHLSLARTRTVLVTNVPDSINSASGLKELAGTVSRLTGTGAPRPSNVTGATGYGGVESETGGVRNVWQTRKVDEVEQVWQDREDECARLETGVGKLIKLGNKNERKGKTPEKQGKLDTERGGADMVDRFVLPKKRPTWKQGFLGLLGQKMTLESSPVYIREHNQQLETMRAGQDDLPLGNTAFLRFASQGEAHSFARLASSTDKSLKLVKTGVEMVPEDVQWDNISMNPYQRKIRTIISWALTITLIIFWAIPVAFVGLVSNVDTLCTKAKFLAWLCTIPAPALGIIKGVLPPALLAVLFILLPIILRAWIKLQGEVRRSDIELKLFSRFWLFQVIHGFLVVTLASGLMNAIPDIVSNPGQTPNLLASQLPGASIFFLTFILTVTFATAAKGYSRAIPFIMFLLKGILGGNTPRKAFLKSYKMDQFAWATVWPPVCLIVCITMVYSVIQPIITLLALLAFGLLFSAYKYMLYWTTDQPDSLETGGLFYIKALRTIFVSLYIEEICLIGLFFLSTGADGKRSKTGLAGGALLIVALILTALLQIYIDWFKFRTDYLVYAHSTSLKGASQTNLNSTFGRVQTSVSDEQENAGPEMGNTSGFHAKAFDHPALWKKQPVIWIADDPLGIGKFEAKRINDARVEASTEYAEMDAKGGLNVDRGPPDEAWYGGYTAE